MKGPSPSVTRGRPRGVPDGSPRGSASRTGLRAGVPLLAALALGMTCGPAGNGSGAAPLRIVDRLEEPADGPFFAPIDVVFAADRIWVLDVGAKRVYGYGLDGRHRATVGRPGSGPGELAQPLAIDAAGDTVWVLDAGNRRIERFLGDGPSLPSRRLPDAVPTPTDLVRHAGGLVVATPFGARPLVRLAADGTGPAFFGAELARASADLRGDASVPDVYRLAVVGEELWAAHLYLPLVAAYAADGRFLRLVRFPAPAVEGGTVETAEEGGVVRRVARAPERPAGTLGVLALGSARYLLTHRRDADGRQALVDLGRDGDPRALEGPPGAFFVAAASDGRRAWVAGGRGELEVPTVFVLEPTRGP